MRRQSTYMDRATFHDARHAVRHRVTSTRKGAVDNNGKNPSEAKPPRGFSFPVQNMRPTGQAMWPIRSDFFFYPMLPRNSSTSSSMGTDLVSLVATSETFTALPGESRMTEVLPLLPFFTRFASM